MNICCLGFGCAALPEAVLHLVHNSLGVSCWHHQSDLRIKVEAIWVKPKLRNSRKEDITTTTKKPQKKPKQQ